MAATRRRVDTKPLRSEPACAGRQHSCPSPNTAGKSVSLQPEGRASPLCQRGSAKSVAHGCLDVATTVAVTVFYALVVTNHVPVGAPSGFATLASEVSGTARGRLLIEGHRQHRRSNAGAWMGLIREQPIGALELALPDTPEVRKRFEDGDIDDPALVLTYAGRTPA